MRMIEANLYPAIPYLHVQQHDREETSMSDFVHADRREKVSAERRTIEYRLMFGACYLLSLAGAIVTRLTPWRSSETASQARSRTSIFREASSTASVWVSSSFVGL
jgi:hypothetical protein